MGSIARPESAAERSDTKHWPILGGFWRQAAPQGVVDDLLERNVQQLRPLLQGVGQIVVKGEGGSHTGIKASMTRDVKVSDRSARTMTATEFRAKCLGLMDEVAETGREIVITKRGRPVARLVPYRQRPRSLFGIDRGRFEIVGDITEPLDVEWEAKEKPDRVSNP